jgi:oxygen-independent coproporphyrinogen-3 oxidase
MAKRVEFKERLTNFYRYPRICLFQDQIADREQFCSYLERPHDRRKLVYLYIHVPFCTSTCNYCPFYHLHYPGTDAATVRAFVDAVVGELKLYARTPHFAGTPIVNVNFGGGTPMVLDLEHLERILRTVFEEFRVAPGAVVSMEGDPRAIQDGDKLRALKGMGLTRASFGIQSFNEALRRKLRVESSVKDVYLAVDSLRRNGVDEWGCDLLYNCPDQNTTELRFNVDRLCELEPSIVDVYDLNISPNTQLAKLVTGGHFRGVPSNAKEIDQFRAIQETFAEHGFEQVRSVNFKPPGARLDRNGVLFQFSEDVLAIGPSARTFLYTAGRNYRNHCSIQKYAEDVAAGRLPIEAGNVVPPAVLEERDMVLFPYYLEVSKESINYPRFQAGIEDMVASGYVEDRGDAIALTAAGRLWAGNVQYYFHSDEEKKAIAQSMFLSLQRGTNLFNQDLVNVA